MSAKSTVSFLLKSGGTVTLIDPFIIGDSVAGTVDGRTISIRDEDIEESR